jgi:hypothetical protein
MEIPISPLSAEALEIYETTNGMRKERTRKVCICGHSMNFHTEVGGRSVCSPGKIRSCKCRESRPILESKNLRLFMFVTGGIGNGHALGKGLTASFKRGVGYLWIRKNGELSGYAQCDICLSEINDPIPVAIDPLTGSPVEVSTGIDKIVCLPCYTSSWVVQ